ERGSADVLVEELDRALEREPRARRVVVGGVRAVEAVARRIQVIDPLRKRLADRLDLAQRDVGVLLAEMQHERASWRIREQLRDPAAVIPNACRGIDLADGG